jgi:hypothetical protein
MPSWINCGDVLKIQKQFCYCIFHPVAKSNLGNVDYEVRQGNFEVQNK